ncbi:MAG TPA: low temperature requirement protein A [Streptosporangiaceae bacterium]|jgi:low temperature requirement protein LtrA
MTGPPGEQDPDQAEHRDPAAGDPPQPVSPGQQDSAPGDQQHGRDDELPSRVTSLELFFDLVFAFTLTQLTALLADRLTAAGIVQVLLVFGLLWWMYEGYAWLTNTRPPAGTVERLLLLLAMGGFLTVGLAIPRGFSTDGVTLGIGYLAVVLVHSLLYFKSNRSIVLIMPFNIASALLVIAAGLVARAQGEPGPAGYALWATALVVQLGSPLIVHPAPLFGLRAAHLVERHTALIIVALGESVAAIGIGAAQAAGERTGQADSHLVAAAVLGLALAAALWWVVFGGTDEEAAERVLAAESSQRRTALALSAFFYGNIPLLLGVVGVAVGLQQAVERALGPAAGPLNGQAVVLAAGTALFLVGEAVIRLRLRTGPANYRAAGAVLALATIPAGSLISLTAQVAILVAVLAMMLAAERMADEGWRWKLPAAS